MFKGNYIDLLREWLPDSMLSMLIVCKDAYGDINGVRKLKWNQSKRLQKNETVAR